MKALALALFLCGCGDGAVIADAGNDATSEVMTDVTSDAGIDAYVPPSLTESGPLILKSATDAGFALLHITSDAGPCVRIENGAHVTIRASEIGPCGGNGVEVVGGDSIAIEDSYVHPEHPATSCCDTGDASSRPARRTFRFAGTSSRSARRTSK